MNDLERAHYANCLAAFEQAKGSDVTHYKYISKKRGKSGKWIYKYPEDDRLTEKGKHAAKAVELMEAHRAAQDAYNDVRTAYNEKYGRDWLRDLPNSTDEGLTDEQRKELQKAEALADEMHRAWVEYKEYSKKHNVDPYSVKNKPIKGESLSSK
jgi:hypothetical protein